MNVYVEQQREVATGDRIQFIAADKQLGVANRDLGTVIRLDSGQITVALDGKTPRAVTFDPATMRHFDHGYAVTSHSSQGLTEGRVLANIDTGSPRSLINSRLAYVAISRASEDARIYTNDPGTLGARLATEVSKSSAIDWEDADTEALESARHRRALSEGREDHFEATWGNLFDSGEEARVNGVPFDEERTAPWKEGWIAVDIGLGMLAEREEQ